MKNKYLILVFTVAFFLLPVTNSYALELHASQLESASLACTDGTKVFGIKGNGAVSSALLVEKDGFILYYNPEFEDIQHILGVYCLQNAIVVMGVYGLATGINAFPFSYDFPYPERIGTTRGSPLMEESQGKTTISLYDDARYGDGDAIIKSVSFYKPFKVKLTMLYHKKVTFLPEMQIANPVEQTVQLSTITTCYGRKSPGMYTVLAYTDAKGESYTSVRNYGSPIKYTAPMPFIATNSMCIDGETYLFGMQESLLRAAKLALDAQGTVSLEIIDPLQAPLRPAIGLNK